MFVIGIRNVYTGDAPNVSEPEMEFIVRQAVVDSILLSQQLQYMDIPAIPLVSRITELSRACRVAASIDIVIYNPDLAIERAMCELGHKPLSITEKFIYESVQNTLLNYYMSK